MDHRLPSSVEDAVLVDLAHKLRDARKSEESASAPPDEVRRWLVTDSRFKGAPPDEVELWLFWLHDLLEAWSLSPEPYEGDRQTAGLLAERFEAEWSRNWYEEEPIKKALDGVERDFDRLAEWLPEQPEVAGASARQLLWARRAVRARTLRNLSA